MKTHKVLLLSLTVSALLSVSALAGGHRGGGGSPGGSGRSSGSSFHSGGFSGSRGMVGSSHRFSSMGVRSMPSGYRSHYGNSTRVAGLGQRRYGYGTLSGKNNLARSGNSRARNPGTIRNNGHGRGSGNVNRGRAGGNNHLFARHSANWHRDWDRHRDHWWNGHRCRFVNGYWFIYDFGYYPWYGFPYDYYGYDYYDPYLSNYDPGVYESAPADSSDQGNYDSSKESVDSPIAAAQARLAEQGYYRGQVDGVIGPETRRAIMRYQSDKGLAPTGRLSTETLGSLGL